MALGAGAGLAIGGILGGVGGLVGDVISSRANKEAQDAANAMNYRIFKETQEYDKPINQVARLKEAGLNPALAYGTGSAANTSPNAPRMEPARVHYDTKFDLLGKYYEVKNQSLQSQQLKTAIDQNEALTGKIKAEAVRSAEEAKAASRRNELWDSVMGPFRAVGGAAQGLWKHGWKDMWDSFVGRKPYELDIKGSSD